jgi:hypothetical protein
VSDAQYPRSFFLLSLLIHLHVPRARNRKNSLDSA